MKPIPIVFHIGPLQIHTYGIGLAITFLFSIWYMARRFRNAGQPWEWLYRDGIWIVFFALLGSRTVHVLANFSYYRANPGEIPLVWHGGLASFGGLLFGVPFGVWRAHRNCPNLKLLPALDLAAPVLVAGWAIGRLLGPQLMIAGGGHQTTAWYGMEYAGQVGKRVPVPIFQSIECWVILAILLVVERRFRERPPGSLIALAAATWGISRFVDEWFWLGVPGHFDAVEGAGLALSAAAWIWLAFLVRRWRRRPPAEEADPVEPGSMSEPPARTGRT